MSVPCALLRIEDPRATMASSSSAFAPSAHPRRAGVLRADTALDLTLLGPGPARELLRHFAARRCVLRAVDLGEGSHSLTFDAFLQADPFIFPTDPPATAKTNVCEEGLFTHFFQRPSPTDTD